MKTASGKFEAGAVLPPAPLPKSCVATALSDLNRSLHRYLTALRASGDAWDGARCRGGTDKT
jgi:hypothetical protein